MTLYTYKENFSLKLGELVSLIIAVLHLVVLVSSGITETMTKLWA